MYQNTTLVESRLRHDHWTLDIERLNIEGGFCQVLATQTLSRPYSQIGHGATSCENSVLQQSIKQTSQSWGNLKSRLCSTGPSIPYVTQFLTRSESFGISDWPVQSLSARIRTCPPLSSSLYCLEQTLAKTFVAPVKPQSQFVIHIRLRQRTQEHSWPPRYSTQTYPLDSAHMRCWPRG